ncbi:TlpA family protein disulfide reductase [Nonlabens sp. Asnod3-A02]|uniref:TlpA family protein disulfide reductase n=1 Tax=Nonlabens sp. Asnod3-A02 TaxID=3160579 RepID=UPI00386A73BA
MSAILNWKNQFVIVGVIYYGTNSYLTFKSNNKREVVKNTLLLIAPFFILYTLMVFYKSLWHVLPICLVSIFSSFFAARFPIVFGSHHKKIFSVFYVLIIISCGYVFMPNWIHYTVSQQKIIKTELSSNVLFKDMKDNSVDLDSLIKGKVVVLDLWSSTCVSCIRYFPKYQEMADKYKDSSVLFLTVNMPIPKRDASINVKQYVAEYSFKNLFADNSIWEEFDVNSTPTYLVFNKKGEVIYKASSIKENEWYYLNSFEDMIDGLIKE